jgi:hypothetical protein
MEGLNRDTVPFLGSTFSYLTFSYLIFWGVIVWGGCWNWDYGTVVVFAFALLKVLLQTRVLCRTSSRSPDPQNKARSDSGPRRYAVTMIVTQASTLTRPTADSHKGLKCIFSSFEGRTHLPRFGATNSPVNRAPILS